MTNYYTRRQLVEDAERIGLYVRTYSPGDGRSRYRFFYGKPADYFERDGIYTALGLREAWTFFNGWKSHRLQAFS